MSYLESAPIIDSESATEEVNKAIMDHRYETASRRVAMARKLGAYMSGRLNGYEGSINISRIESLRRKAQQEGSRDIDITGYQKQHVTIIHTSSSGQKENETLVMFAAINQDGQIEFLQRNGQNLAVHKDVYDARLTDRDRVLGNNVDCRLVPVIDPYGHGIDTVLVLRRDVPEATSDSIELGITTIEAPKVNGNGHNGHIIKEGDLATLQR